MHSDRLTVILIAVSLALLCSSCKRVAGCDAGYAVEYWAPIIEQDV